MIFKVPFQKCISLECLFTLIATLPVEVHQLHVALHSIEVAATMPGRLIELSWQSTTWGTDVNVLWPQLGSVRTVTGKLFRGVVHHVSVESRESALFATSF